MAELDAAIDAAEILSEESLTRPVGTAAIDPRNELTPEDEERIAKDNIALDLLRKTMRSAEEFTEEDLDRTVGASA